MIDWTDPTCKVSKYFTVKDAIWLPSWNRLASVGDGLTPQIEQTLSDFLIVHMDAIKDFLEADITVHCCYRPPAYNQHVGGAVKSAHMALEGAAAMDFDIGEVCDYTRAKLLTELSPRRLRMENNPGSDWIHLDNALVKTSRYFRP